jgi:Family of unknown function (DUF6134)
MLQLCPDRERLSIQRRAVLIGGVAGAVVGAVPAIAHAATELVLPTAAADRRFSVLYKGFKIGTHTISYSSATDEARVNTDIHLEVKIAFVSAYSYSHRSEETWRAGRLMSLTSDTVEHGEPLHVEGAATPQGFRVVSKSGPFIASAATLTSNSLWTPAMLEQSTVVDAQHGGVIGVSANKVADEAIVIAGGQVRATRYTFITPYYAGSVWYDNGNHWVRAEFERDGSQVQYQLDT